jgi:methionyl-tRNA formyltransferase
MTSPRVLFAGTPDFALASLVALVDANMVPDAVLTQPDRPAGRGKRMTASPVKRYADEKNIPVLQPQSLRDPASVAALRALNPDVLIVAAYGLILPQDVLDIPTLGCLNVHASLLPRWRGAAPIQAAILADDPTTGISLMSMTAGLDCGPVYIDEAIAIGKHETAGELHDRLAQLGGRLLVANLEEIFAGKLLPTAQDESLATYAGKIRSADARIDWTFTADDIVRCVRAYNPVPGAWFTMSDERVKCWRAESRAQDDDERAVPGTVLSAGADGIAVACGNGVVMLQALQRPGKGRISARDFAAQTRPAEQVLG